MLFFFFFTALKVSCHRKRKRKRCPWEMGFQETGGDLAVVRRRPLPWVLSGVQAPGCWSTCMSRSLAVGLSIRRQRAPGTLLKPVEELLANGPPKTSVVYPPDGNRNVF